MTSDVTTLDDATLSPGTAPGGRRGCHPKWTALAVTAAVVTLGALTGCGGASSTGATAVNSTSPSSSALATAPSDGSSKAPYTDAEACAWLKENLPKVPDTKVGAAAQLAIGLSAFFEDHGGLAGADGYALDDAFGRGCPTLRTAALKKAGIKSFGNL
jgi:hypothetical protein